jgi:hypothetical protein
VSTLPGLLLTYPIIAWGFMEIRQHIAREDTAQVPTVMSRGRVPASHIVFLGLGHGQPMMVATFASPSIVPLPPQSLASSSPSIGVSEDTKHFIMVQSLSLYLMAYEW